MSSLKNIREKFGISQQQVAHWLGISRSLAAHYESGIRSLPTHALLQLAKLEIVLAEFEKNVSGDTKHSDKNVSCDTNHGDENIMKAASAVYLHMHCCNLQSWRLCWRSLKKMFREIRTMAMKKMFRGTRTTAMICRWVMMLHFHYIPSLLFNWIRLKGCNNNYLCCKAGMPYCNSKCCSLKK